MTSNNKIILGQFGAVYGVRGWLKVSSYTDPIENLLNYPKWQVQHKGAWETITIEEGKTHGKTLVVKIEGLHIREEAQVYTNDYIAIEKEALAKLPEGEYYWRDLIGLNVITKEGTKLGTVQNLLETGSNDVLIVKDKKEIMIPYTKNVIISVDLENKVITVDWDPNY